jgi:hypothetical protein
MAFLYIGEYEKTGNADFGPAIQAPLEPPLRIQKVAIGATATSAAAFHEKTRLLELHTDVACHYRVSSNGAPATNADMRLPAGSIVYRTIPNHLSMTVSVIAE